MTVNFISTDDTGKISTFYVHSDNEEIRLGNETDNIISSLSKPFLCNYQEEDKILRSDSSFVFEIVDMYNWKGIDFPAGVKDWEKFEENNKEVALNILYVPHNTKEIILAYKSKYNRKRKDQIVLLMITDGKQSDKIGWI